MALKLMGKKRGMTQLFDDKGLAFACTVIELEPNVITQIKTIENDGYNAIQLGFELVTAKDPRRQEARTSKPLRGHFAKAKVAPRKHLLETRIEKSDGFEVGQEIGVGIFADNKFVDVTGQSKGKGFQGVMKRYHYSGGPASHGSGFHREAGSTGFLTSHGRCFPGDKRAGHMGDQTKTVQNLEIFLVDEEKNVLVVKGAIPGAPGGLVSISSAVKRPEKKGS